MQENLMITAATRLKNRIEQLSHTAKKSLGQNFLVSDSVIQKIIDAVDSTQPTQLLEVGPGLGALTDLLIEKYGTYQLIELDHHLGYFWKNEKKMPVIEGDALRIDWSLIDYDVLVSNLPYQISSSLVIERSIDAKPCKAMVLMFQKEVAQRIRAPHQTEHYGLLSVIAQEFWTIETVCEAGPRDFNPAPKVASRVLKFKQKKSDIENKLKYLEFVKICFKQRRRILKSNLDKTMHDKLYSWIDKHNLNDKVRAEELSPELIKSLYKELYA